MSGALHYSSNNSGGYWWLKDTDWEALEKAGWTVHWYHSPFLAHDGFTGGTEDDPHVWAAREAKKYPALTSSHSHRYGTARFVHSEFPEGFETHLGAKAASASKRFDSREEGINEWERLTNQNASAEGCNCCGEPHYFEWEDDNGNTSHSSVFVAHTETRWS